MVDGTKNTTKLIRCEDTDLITCPAGDLKDDLMTSEQGFSSRGAGVLLVQHGGQSPSEL